MKSSGIEVTASHEVVVNQCGDRPPKRQRRRTDSLGQLGEPCHLSSPGFLFFTSVSRSFPVISCFVSILVLS